MSITVHFHAAAGGDNPTNGQATARTGSGTANGMDGGASVPAAGAEGMTNGKAHVDSPTTATDAGGPPAELVRMVEAAFASRGASDQQAGPDKRDNDVANDAGAAPHAT